MCEKCGDIGLKHDVADEGRRRLLVGGAGIAAASPFFLSGAQAQTEAQPIETGPSKVRAFGAPAASQPLTAMEVDRRGVGPKDVLIDIMYCGICHSDIHTVRDQWGPSKYPAVPGHEIVGRVRAVGRDVTKFRVGDIAGVGCMVNSCGTCENCLNDMEQYCLNGNTLTYQSPDKELGGYTQGGYADAIVVTEAFVIRIPPGANLAATAPLLCAAVTTFSPMQHWKLEAGQRVGIVGMGGLGHLAVKLAVARKADVTVFTTSADKVADARRFGARDAVVSTDTAAMESHAAQYDLLISTIPQPFAVQPFLNLLRLNGTMVTVGVLQELEDVRGSGLWRRRRSLAASIIGGIAETQEVVDYCASRNISADVEIIQPDQINEAMNRVVNKQARYRFVIDMTAGRQG
jgi:uncharacterized zinc-type alcohol dehydrogenase-like protein